MKKIPFLLAALAFVFYQCSGGSRGPYVVCDSMIVSSQYDSLGIEHVFKEWRCDTLKGE
jgi:hypothetical protein